MTRADDPYAILGVSRNASRAEIARAYRALARKHHPDAGAPPSPTMARVNEAWHILSDPNRRARWDREHTMPIQPAHWAQTPEVRVPRQPAAPPAPPSRMDSPWVVAGVIGAIAAVVAVAMIGVSMAANPPQVSGLSFTSPELELRHPAGWSRARGDRDQDDAHRIIVHFVTYDIPAEDLCTVYGEPCEPSPADVPPGEASIVIIAFEGGTPPEPEPLVKRPYGLDADDLIGGKPAASERRPAPGEHTLMWYQLSPPGFPDRWIEVHAVINDDPLDESPVLGDIQAMLDSLEFRDTGS